MSQYFEVHPDNPQPRLLKQAARSCDDGGIAAVPTDSSYALVCHLDDKAAADQLRRIRGVDDKHHLTLLCRDLSELASYARVDNRQYRLLKPATPGPYTFILEATKEVPRRAEPPVAPDHRPARARPQGAAGAAGAARPAAAGHHADRARRDRAAERRARDPRALRAQLAGRDRRRRLPAASRPPWSTSRGDEPVVLRQGRGDLADWACEPLQVRCPARHSETINPVDYRPT